MSFKKLHMSQIFSNLEFPNFKCYILVMCNLYTKFLNFLEICKQFSYELVKEKGNIVRATNSRNHILCLNVRMHECMNESKLGHNWMRIDESVTLYSNVLMYRIPIIRSFLNGYKGMCEPFLKPASSSGKPFSEQSSSHTSRVLIRKN